MNLGGSVHVACGELAALLQQAPRPPDWLSLSERNRLATMRTSSRRDQFIAARWQARWLLAQVRGGVPTDWSLTAPPDAPPGVANDADLHVSVSHSGHRIACAVGAVPIGLDLEAPRRQRDIAGLVDVCCTPAERALFENTDADALFYELWTVKEAWLKRRREWIAPSRLRQLEARPGDGDLRAWRGDGWWLALCASDARVRWWTPEPAASRAWQLADLAA